MWSHGQKISLLACHFAPLASTHSGVSCLVQSSATALQGQKEHIPHPTWSRATKDHRSRRCNSLLLSLVAASNRIAPLTAKDSGEVLAPAKLHPRLTPDSARNKSLREKTEITMYGGGLAHGADDQDSDDGASGVSSTVDSASDSTLSGQKRKVEPLSDAQLEGIGTPPPGSVVRICKQGFPLWGSSQFSDRKKIIAAGGEWNKTKKMWKAKDIDTLNRLLRTHAWRPAGVSQQHFGLLAEGFEYVTKYNAALAKAQRVQANQKRVRTEEEEDADRRTYLGIPNITDQDKADFKKQHGLVYEHHRSFVKMSTKLPQLGPRAPHARLCPGSGGV